MGNRRALSVEYKGENEFSSAAKRQVSSPGDLVVVRRGVIRAAVMKCPDGCGDDLVINLDRRAGPAWRLYRRKGRITLYPSVWRESGCQSHFIVWNNRIFWCDYDSLTEDEGEHDELDARALAALTLTPQHYRDVADKLDETPWPVLLSCRRLVKKGLAQEGSGDDRGQFRRADAKS